MFDKKFYLNLFFIGFVLILIQGVFQNYDSMLSLLKSIISTSLPFIYAIFMAILLNPVVVILEKKLKLKRLYSLIITLILLILIITGIFFIVVPNLMSSTTDLINRFPQMLAAFNQNATQFISFLKEKNLLFFDPNEIENNLIKFVKDNVGNFKNIILILSLDVVQGVMGVATFLLGTFLALFLIQDKEYYFKFLNNFLFLITDRKKADNIVEILEEAKNIFLKYIWGRLVTSFAVGLTAYIVMLIAKVPYALISGLLIGVGNMIPYIGSILAGAIAVFLIVLAAPFKLVYLFLAIAIGQSVDGFILGPKIVAEAVGMSVFWTIAAIIIFGNLMGPVGLFLGVPILAVVKLIYEKKLKEKENL